MSCEYCKYIDDQKILEWNHAKQSEDDQDYYYDEIEPTFCPKCGGLVSSESPLTIEQVRQWKMCEPLFVKLLPPCHASRWEIPTSIVQGMERMNCKGGETYFMDSYGTEWVAYLCRPSEIC